MAWNSSCKTCKDCTALESHSKKSIVLQIRRKKSRKSGISLGSALLPAWWKGTWVLTRTLSASAARPWRPSRAHSCPGGSTSMARAVWKARLPTLFPSHLFCLRRCLRRRARLFDPVPRPIEQKREVWRHRIGAHECQHKFAADFERTPMVVVQTPKRGRASAPPSGVLSRLR